MRDLLVIICIFVIVFYNEQATVRCEFEFELMPFHSRRGHSKLHNMNFQKISYLLVVLILFASCDRKGKDQKKENPPVAVDVMIAAQQDFPASIEVNGSVLSQEMVELHPEVSGRITYLNIPDGATVKEGTLLAKINDADLQAQLEQQQVKLDLAVKTEQRLKKLLAVNGIDQATYDAALNEVNLLQANIKVLHAQIDKTVIKAPFTGVLGLRQISVGAYVTPLTVVGTLQQSDKIKIDFTVPSTYEHLVSEGGTVTIQQNDVKEPLSAVITAVEPQISTVTRNLRVRASLSSGNMRPGTFVKVILTENIRGIVVPANALIQDAASNQVVVVKHGKAEFRQVETGTRTASMVELLSGVSPGDSMIVSGMLFVRPDGKVKVKKVIKSTMNAED